MHSMVNNYSPSREITKAILTIDLTFLWGHVRSNRFLVNHDDLVSLQERVKLKAVF